MSRRIKRRIAKLLHWVVKRWLCREWFEIENSVEISPGIAYVNSKKVKL